MSDSYLASIHESRGSPSFISSMLAELRLNQSVQSLRSFPKRLGFVFTEKMKTIIGKEGDVQAIDHCGVESMG
jgi:hypothetical protein